MEDNKITSEALQKAFSLLDEATAMIKGQSNSDLGNSDKNDLEKGDKGDDENDEINKAMETATDLIKKGMSKESGCEYLSKAAGFSVEVAQASWEKALSATQAQKEGGEPEKQEVPLMKSEEVVELIKSELTKSLDPVNGSLNKVNEVIEKGIGALTTIVKSVQEQNNDLIKANEVLNGRLEILEKTPNTRKSFTNAAYIDKFQKSATGDTDLAGKDVYDVTKQDDLSRLSDRLLTECKDALEKGRKEDAALFEGTINSIEISKKVPEFAYRKLASMNIVLQAPPKN